MLTINIQTAYKKIALFLYLNKDLHIIALRVAWYLILLIFTFKFTIFVIELIFYYQKCCHLSMWKKTPYVEGPDFVEYKRNLKDSLWLCSLKRVNLRSLRPGCMKIKSETPPISKVDSSINYLLHTKKIMKDVFLDKLSLQV